MTPDDDDDDLEYHISSLPDETQRYLLALQPEGIALARLKEYLRGLEPPVMVPQDAVAEIMGEIEQRVAAGIPLKEAKDALIPFVDRVWGNP